MTRPAWLAAMEGWFVRALTGWRILVLPILFFAITRQLLFPWFGQTNQLFVDWYNHTASLGAFLFGFAVAGREEIWRELERQRWRALVVALVALPPLMMLVGEHGELGAWARRAVYGVNQWAAIATILGFGSRHLRRADGPVLRYLTDAVFPLYLVHQTILVAAIYAALAWRLPAPLEAGFLLAATLGGSLLVYELVRRIGPIRPLWGLKRLGPARPPVPPAVTGGRPAEVA